MEYKIVKFKYKNGIEDISIVFEGNYQILTTFLVGDVLDFQDWIKESFEKVLSGKSEHAEIAGNSSSAEITPKTTKIYFTLAEEDDPDYWLELDTKELYDLICEWCKIAREFYKERKKA